MCLLARLLGIEKCTIAVWLTLCRRCRWQENLFRSRWSLRSVVPCLGMLQVPVHKWDLQKNFSNCKASGMIKFGSVKWQDSNRNVPDNLANKSHLSFPLLNFRQRSFQRFAKDLFILFYFFGVFIFAFLNVSCHFEYFLDAGQIFFPPLQEKQCHQVHQTMHLSLINYCSIKIEGLLMHIVPFYITH